VARRKDQTSKSDKRSHRGAPTNPIAGKGDNRNTPLRSERRITALAAVGAVAIAGLTLLFAINGELRLPEGLGTSGAAMERAC
jgi:ABC-type Fe3+-siderophore transport system permease subunit